MGMRVGQWGGGWVSREEGGSVGRRVGQWGGGSCDYHFMLHLIQHILTHTCQLFLVIMTTKSGYCAI